MQLNITTDYAIRSLLYISLKDTLVPSADIAEAMKIPQQYLITVLTKLKHAGLVSVIRGHAGGYCLCRTADEISLLEIIEAVEGTTRINRCLEEDRYCSRFATEHCPVRQVYCAIQDTMESSFRGVTLRELKEKL